ncbi:MAG: hypothetical protein EXR70_10930 [Deltaproteobacteria bacterium]|nr:hypothetical protein [Deltaproteobacteria bacterium]
MNTRNNSKILQVIAAQPGWKAIYCQEADSQQIKISSQVVICWALVEASGTDYGMQSEVKGIVQDLNHLGIAGDLIGAGEKLANQYLLGYNDPDAHKESDYWLEQAKARLRRELDKAA